METRTASQKAKYHMYHVSTTMGFYIAMCALRAEWNNVENLHDAAIPSLKGYGNIFFYYFILKNF
jgi:hypothetical protein